MPQVIDWPLALRPRTVEWGLAQSQASGRSAFDNSVQAVTLGAPRWVCSITTGTLRHDEVPAWEALIDQLDGAVNRVRLWDWRREGPLGPATGTPTVRVAALGNTLQTQGWAASVAGLLRAGSYFGLGVGGELKRLVADASSDALGRATLSFRPPLRAMPVVGTALVLVRPTAKFVLTTARPLMQQEGALTRGWTLAFEEDPS